MNGLAAVLVLVFTSGWCAFVIGRSWGERFPRQWPTAWDRFRCRVLGHRWWQPEGVFTHRRCTRCDTAAPR